MSSGRIEGIWLPLLPEVAKNPVFGNGLVYICTGFMTGKLFAIHGEEYYRRVELAALRRFLAGGRPAVLATGGGVVTSPDAFRLLCEATRTVWLRASRSFCFSQ